VSGSVKLRVNILSMGRAGAALLHPFRVSVVLSNDVELRKMKLKIISLKLCKDKGKIYPRTSHDFPQGE